MDERGRILYGRIEPDYDHPIDVTPDYRVFPLTWVGPKIARVSWHILQKYGDGPQDRYPAVGDVHNLGPFRVRVVESHLVGFCLVTRDGFKSYLMQDALALLWTWTWIKTRIILTACVWGLGRWPDGAHPSWRDIYLINRLTTSRIWKELF